MKNVLAGMAALAVLATAAATAPALADDRQPTAEELTQIEQTLRAEGFTSWDDIELDDGVFEVDDAVHSDGRKYDLELDPQTYAIVKRELD